MGSGLDSAVPTPLVADLDVVDLDRIVDGRARHCPACRGLTLSRGRCHERLFCWVATCVTELLDISPGHMIPGYASAGSLQGGALMRVFVAILALFPILAPAQDLGTFQFTSGDISVGNITEISGNGFTGVVGGGPELLSAPGLANFHGGSPSLNFCFGCGLAGTDDGVW